jgi:hypothetical protein
MTASMVFTIIGILARAIDTSVNPPIVSTSNPNMREGLSSISVVSM